MTGVGPCVVDALGLRCPLPVLKLERALAACAPGQTVVLLADDPVAAIDVPHVARALGHAVSVEERHDGDAKALRFTITVAGADGAAR